jgi:cardiolipin synthase C
MILMGVALSTSAAAVAIVIGVVRSYEDVQSDALVVSSQAELAEVFFALPWEGDDDVSALPLSDPARAWLSRWRLLNEAEQRIDVAYFILDGDLFGLSFLGALLAAAERGVLVRVLVDGLATDMADARHTLTGKNFLSALGSHPNIEVRTYRPLLERVFDFAKNLQLASLIASEHDKIIHVDGEWTLTGGRNIAEAYFTPARRAGHQFLDTDVLIRSTEVARQIQTAFERPYASADPKVAIAMESGRRVIVERARAHMDGWLRGYTVDPSDDSDLQEMEQRWQEQLEARPELRNALSSFELSGTFSARVRVIDSHARVDADVGELTQAVLQLAATARQEVVLISPYFVLDESFTSVLANAARRGVRITVLTNSPGSSDNTLSQALFLEQWPTLLARIPNMKLYVVGGNDTLHDKVILFDDTLSMVGTYNLDPTARRMNSELMVGFWSKTLNQHFRRQLERHIAGGPPTSYEYRLKRGPDGSAELDEHGHPLVLFGPEHHLSDAQMKGTREHQELIRKFRATLNLEPFVRTAPHVPTTDVRAP